MSKELTPRFNQIVQWYYFPWRMNQTKEFLKNLRGLS